MASAGPRTGSVRSKLIVNTILAVAFVAISAPQATRIPAHEWLSLAFIGVLTLHLLFSWSWIVGVSARFLSRLRGPVRFNFLLDTASYLAMVGVMVSGIVISESALPALGLPRPRDRFWSVVHDLTSEALLVLIGVHLAMHWDWVMAALRRVLGGEGVRNTAGAGGAGRWWRPAATLAAVSLIATVATLALGRTSIAERMRQGGPRARPAAGGEAAVRRGREPGAEPGAGAGRGEGGSGEVRRADAGQQPAAPAGTSSAVAPDSSPEAVSSAAPRQREAGRRRASGGAARGRREGGGGQLTWRQRYLRPGIKIAGWMGIPFLLTLGVLAVARRERSVPDSDDSDLLEQRVD